MTERPKEKNFPRIRITWQAFQELFEYSASYPTGVFPGKRWRRLDGAFDSSCLQPRWYVLEYVEKDEKHCTIKWYKPILYACPPPPKVTNK